MNFLIDIYDNFLIYHPNIFFPLLFLLSILGLILMIAGVIFLKKGFTKITKRMKINLSKINVSTPKLTIDIFYLVKLAWVLIVKINKILSYLELKIEKILVKIRKEVLID